MDGLPFVTGAIWHRPRDVSVQVRVREPRKSRPPPGSGGGKSSSDSNADAAARKLTSQIKDGVQSATELLHLLDRVVDGPIFNKFHASAAYNSLATWKWKGGLTPSDKASPVLPRLAARVQNLVEEGQLGSREVANVLYSLGKLSDDVEVPEGLLMALVKFLRERASDMNAHDLSNTLLACVQLKVVRPEVLSMLPQLAAQISMKAKDMVPQALSNSLWASAQLKEDAGPEDVARIVAALVRQIPVKAKDMIPQALSISLWAATRLKDSAREVLQMVPALVEEIPRKQAGFFSQEICNCLEGLVLLEDSVPEVGKLRKNGFVEFAVSRFSQSLPTLKGKDLAIEMPVVVWACAKINFYHEELLVSVAQRWKSGGTLQTLTDWSICALLWSYDVLDSDGEFANFKDTLESERDRRGFSDSDVLESRLGYFDWYHAKG